MLSRHLLLLGSIGLGLLGTAAPASAFCRSRTCGDRCTRDEHNCPIEGKPIEWAGSYCLSYSIQRDGTSAVSHADLSQAADAAFRTWQTATCPDTQSAPTISIHDIFGATACGRVEFNSRQANANVIVIREDWEGASNVLGLTTVSINSDTGDIFDADMEINGTQLLSVGPLMPNYYDLESIITHEAGHFLGLDHSDVGLDQDCTGGATMCPSYHPGTAHFRTLDDDDIAAICTVYPPDRNLPLCDPTPHRGFSPQCGMDPLTAGGCSIPISPGRPAGGALTAVAFSLSLGMERLRRRRQRAQKLR